MSIQLITGFNSASREHLDKRSGPYESVSEALLALGTNSRVMGLPIYVIENGTKDEAGNWITGDIKTFNFDKGIEDLNLVEITSSLFGLDDSYYYDTDGTLRPNIATFRETLNYNFVSTTFNLSFNSTYFESIVIFDATSSKILRESDYQFNGGKSLTILANMPNVSEIVVTYNHFVIEPS